MEEAFEIWVNDLLEEGYDLSDYTWDEIYEIFEETAKEKEERIAARRARVKEMTAKGEVMTPQRRARERARQRRQEQQDEKLDRILSQVRGETGRRVSERPMGSEPSAPKQAAPEATRRLKTGLKRDTLGKAADDILKSIRNEEYELYSHIVGHLIENGYAEDIDSANTMIMHMSEEWVESIIKSV